ncbi:MAG: Ig-like domain-containing protein [Methylococcales bacterium]|nr:Ig-like domain-containing protein [Methylococcales bacterium]
MANTTGTNNNDSWNLTGTYSGTLDGLGGVDTLGLGSLKRTQFTLTQNTDGSIKIDTVAGSSGKSASHIVLKNMEVLQYDYASSSIDLTTYFPKVVSFSPTDGAMNAPIDQPIVLTFNKAITKGTAGSIAIHQGSATGTVLETFQAATDKLLSFSNDTLTITPKVILAPNTHYYVTIDTGAVKDTSGNNYIDTASYDFTTQAATDTGTINHSPVVAPSISALTAKEGVAFSYDANQLFSDSDGDTLTFTANGLPSWLTLTNAGKLSGTPSYTSADTSSNSINIIANDGHNPNVTTTLTLNITNVASITGTVGADNLLAGAGSDTISGLAGNDTINGGLGNDQLTGGAGADTFVFNMPLSSTNIDTITDFVHGTDKIQLAKSFMANVGVIGVLKSADFKLSTAKLDASDRIVYNKTTGDLFYDSDGSGLVAAVKIAIIGASSHPTLSNTDFTIV